MIRVLLALCHAVRVQHEAEVLGPGSYGYTEQLASALLLSEVDAGLKAAGVKLPVNTSAPHKLTAAEQAATKKALDSLRHDDPDCVLAGDLVYTDLVNATAESVLHQGLPAWNMSTPNSTSDVAIGYLIQVAGKKQLPLVKRVFDRLYSPKDTFLYLTDVSKLSVADVQRALQGNSTHLPANVEVQAAKHTGFFFWPRVEVVLTGIQRMVAKDRWDVLVHMSESGYPLHHSEWIRSALGMYRHTSFIEAVPYSSSKVAASPAAQAQKFLAKAPAPAAKAGEGEPHSGASKAEKATKPVKDQWWFWAKKEPVASCGVSAVPVSTGPHFPLDEMTKRGFDFRHGEEWNVLTRELCEYVSQPGLADFKKLLSFRWGADEMFWATLVSNIPNFTQRIEPTSMWFKRWQGHGSTPHSPDLLQWPHHTPELFESRSHRLFTRKLRLPESQTTVEMLDADADNETVFANGTVAFFPLAGK